MTIPLTFWRCIPCGATSNIGDSCFLCGRPREVATDEVRWERFFTVDAVVALTAMQEADQNDDLFGTCDDCGAREGQPCNLDVEH